MSRYKNGKATEIIYMTSEKYHNLNKNISYTTDYHSTSTLFYDLDNLAVHSYVDLSRVSKKKYSSNTKINSSFIHSIHGLKGNSYTFVQECETQILPVLLPRDSLEVQTKKVEKCFPNDPEISSEIYLKDDDFTNIAPFNDSDKNIQRKQKYWSYAKYRTEYTNPTRQDKKSKKKDHTRQIEDPCPCQLFSYTCPCADDKCLAGLKNSKSLSDQVTSTTNIVKEERKDDRKETKLFKKNHKGKSIVPKDDKPTSITCIIDNLESVEKSDPTLLYTEKYDVISHTETMNNKGKSKRKKRQVMLCPNCKEKVEFSSMDPSEEEGSIIYEDLSYQPNDSSPGKSVYTYKTAVKKQMADKSNDRGSCHHNPTCDLVPLCQLLPTDNVFLSPKITKKQETSKTSPRVIRITKACRHHPPCTVAPSCQRANILKNNCEYIPPCLHRPRCVNLPLCVPFSKNIPYDELKHVEEMENGQCPHVPRCTYIPECRNIYSGNLSNQVNMAQLPNGYGMFAPPAPYNVLSPCLRQSFSPCQIHPPGYIPDYGLSRSDKSCQYDTLGMSYNPSVPRIVSSEAVVFIRDVGCQFRNRYNSPIDSIRITKSSTSFDHDNVNLGVIYTNVHTLRYEDKFTNPKGKMEVSVSSLSLTSNNTSHLMDRYDESRNRTSGFDPKPTKSPFVAYATNIGSYKHYIKEKNNTHPFPTKSRLSITRNKYRKFFNIKRKKKKRGDSQLVYRKPISVGK
ncbi:uncharacterized protein LOC132902235 [Amyelois transitella]|uniref:uncharacterized protein LOC132902235 n=1 Tax=Amyelois transitella TaxID=680683 RepID=UPI00298F5484|nr:uncharacterized protein LOC132902235 [Amyelois transitella]